MPDQPLQELLNLLNYDRECAYRLIEQVKRQHPKQSLEWCINKVLLQLKQDRS